MPCPPRGQKRPQAPAEPSSAAKKKASDHRALWSDTAAMPAVNHEHHSKVVCSKLISFCSPFGNPAGLRAMQIRERSMCVMWGWCGRGVGKRDGTPRPETWASGCVVSRHPLSRFFGADVAHQQKYVGWAQNRPVFLGKSPHWIVRIRPMAARIVANTSFANHNGSHVDIPEVESAWAKVFTHEMFQNVESQVLWQTSLNLGASCGKALSLRATFHI